MQCHSKSWISYWLHGITMICNLNILGCRFFFQRENRKWNHFYCSLTSFLNPTLEADVKVPWLCAGRQGSLWTMSRNGHWCQFAAVLRKIIFNAQTRLFIMTAYTPATAACVTLLMIQKKSAYAEMPKCYLNVLFHEYLWFLSNEVSGETYKPYF